MHSKLIAGTVCPHQESLRFHIVYQLDTYKKHSNKRSNDCARCTAKSYATSAHMRGRELENSCAVLCTLSFLGVSCTTYTRCETYFSNQMLSTAYPPLILPINASNPCVFDKEICRTLYQKCNALVYTYNQILSSLA